MQPKLKSDTLLTGNYLENGIFIVQPGNDEDSAPATLEALELARAYPQQRIMLSLHNGVAVDVNRFDTSVQQILDRWLKAEREARMVAANSMYVGTKPITYRHLA